MRDVQSHIPDLLAKTNMNTEEFAGLCYSKGLSLKTAEKVAAGDPNVTVRTLRIVAEVLNVSSISQLIEFV